MGGHPCNEALHACAPDTLAGYILSRNPDFTTDDRTFFRNETMYMLAWPHPALDINDISVDWWKLEDANGKKINKPWTNNLDGTFTASWDLQLLPSNAVDWSWDAWILSGNGVFFFPVPRPVPVQVLPQCTTDADCDDGLFCNGVETCDVDGVCQSNNAPCSGNQSCDDAGDFCYIPVCGDGACNGTETACDCTQDCGPPPAGETVCNDGLDNDCDGLIDCDDVDCVGPPFCPDCLPDLAACASDADCCGGRCRLVNGAMICD